MRARSVTVQLAAFDPTVRLAQAIVERAVLDARGRQLLPGDRRHKERLRSEALDWLHDAVCDGGLLDALDIHHIDTSGI